MSKINAKVRFLEGGNLYPQGTHSTYLRISFTVHVAGRVFINAFAKVYQ